MTLIILRDCLNSHLTKPKNLESFKDSPICVGDSNFQTLLHNIFLTLVTLLSLLLINAIGQLVAVATNQHTPSF